MTTDIDIFWVDAGPKHVAAMVSGKVFKSRFKEEAINPNWVSTDSDGYELTLNGWENGTFIDSEGDGWSLCQVYDPPESWLQKPDPGPEHVLLKKSPGEPLQEDDEAFWPCDQQWHKHKEGSGKQIFNMWYRRKIKPPKPKYKVGDWVKVTKPAINAPNCGISWLMPMDQYDGKVRQVERVCSKTGNLYLHQGVSWIFHTDWLTPVEKPKPDPGEEYRLLEKNPDEALQPGDESLGIGQNPKWFPSEQAKIGGRQVEGIWYRRRLELQKPDPGPGHRLLKKSPDEPKLPTDEIWSKSLLEWFPLQPAILVDNVQEAGYWYRRKLEPTEFAAKTDDKILLPSGKVLIITANGVEIE